MAKSLITTKNVKPTEIVKQRSKTFAKEVKAFNNRLKRAVKNKKISPDVYATLFIDKDKKDFYKSNIYNKKQFNSFVKMLKQANNKTLKDAKKRIGINELKVSQYERWLYKNNFKYLDDFDEMYETKYTDLAVNVNRKTREKLFRRLQKVEFIVKNKNIQFKKNFLIAIDKTFNESKKTKNIKEMVMKMTDEELEYLLETNPNFSIAMVYSEIQDEDTRIENIEESLNRVFKKFRKLKKTGKNEITSADVNKAVKYYKNKNKKQSSKT